MEDKGILEKHIQTIIASIILAITLWMGKTIAETQTAVAVLNTQVQATSIQIGGLKDQLNAATRDQFKRVDWEREKSAILSDTIVLTKRVDKIEDQMSVMLQHIILDGDEKSTDRLQNLRKK